MTRNRGAAKRGNPPGLRAVVVMVLVALIAPVVHTAMSAKAAETTAPGAWQTTTPMDVNPGSTERALPVVLLDPSPCHQAVPPPNYPCGKAVVVGTGLTRGSTVDIYDPASQRWTTSAPSPAEIPFGDGTTATLLDGAPADCASDCGKVLFAGGSNASAQGSAGLYDPVTDTWAAVDPMTTDRAFHSATRLADGRVLVAGGRGNDPLWAATSRSAEVYDPRTRKWTPVIIPMSSPRDSATATLLPDGIHNGKVLVVGGNGVADSAELFDAAAFDAGTNPWQPVTPMSTSRRSHTATLLRNGKVLVVGGFNFTAGDGRPEIFDPDDGPTGSWTSTGPIASFLVFHSAVLMPSGKVLVAGGSPGVDTFVYDPDQGTWTAGPPMISKRSSHGSVLLRNGQALVMGGQGYFDGTAASAELFDENAKTSSPIPQILGVKPRFAPVEGQTEVTISGVAFREPASVRFGTEPATSVKVNSSTSITAVAPAHVAETVDITVTSPGGTSALSRHDKFSFTGQWQDAGDMKAQPRYDHTATVIRDGRVLVAGGGPDGSSVDDKTLLYDPDAAGPESAWSSAASLPTPRRNHTASLLGDDRGVLIAGGTAATGSPTAASEIYVPEPGAAGEWKTTKEGMGTARKSHTATVLPTGQVLVVGGFGPISTAGTESGPLRSAEIYDPSFDTWTPTKSMDEARSDHSATLLADGRVLVVGGVGNSGALASAEIYDPNEDEWTQTGSLHSPMSRHAAVLLDDGDVFVTTGRTPASERFDPTAGGWTVAADAPSGGYGGATTSNTVVLGDGTVMVTVGDSGHPQIYDPSRNSWRYDAPLTKSRYGHTASVLQDGSVLAAGGVGGVGSAERYGLATIASPPAVAAVDPPIGSTTGSTRVTISGSFLFPLVSVRFGRAEAKVLYSSPSTVIVEAPAQPQGDVDVTVTTPVATSKVSDASRFTYVIYAGGTWFPTDTLGSCGASCAERYLHTATALADGKVLVAGGTTDFYAWYSGDQNGTLSSAELYDPTSGKWTATAPLTVARFEHTATLLDDGQVLVTGGQDDEGNAIASAEVYNPKDGKWRPTGSLLMARYAHTATLLDNGQVLVTGGSTAHETLRSGVTTAELYDPEALDPVTQHKGMWSPVAPMSDARKNHTATLLADNRVLVAGGISGQVDPVNGTNVLNSAEIYDPDDKTWTTTESMAVGRVAHTATLLTGARCAQSSAAAACGTVLVAGGGQPSGVTESTELFDANSNGGSGGWIPAGIMHEGRLGHTATLLADGRLLVAGSGPLWPDDQHGSAVASAEVFDPAIGRWGRTLSLDGPRGGHTTTLLPDGRALAAGGYRRDGYTGASIGEEQRDTLASPAQIYIPAPVVSAVSPPAGSAQGGTAVTISGSNFMGITQVVFGDTPSTSVTVDSPTQLTAVAPAHAKGPVNVAVVNAGGTSALAEPDPAARFVFVGAPAQINNLVAAAVAAGTIRLGFSAPDDGTGTSPAGAYVVKQSTSPITTDAGFDAARALCGGTCTQLSPATIGQPLELRVERLAPATTYYYAVKAVGVDGTLGPLSNQASATTAGTGASSPTTDAASGVTECAATAAPGPDQVAYAGGAYSLIGLPAGTQVPTEAPMYSWMDLGNGGAYSAGNDATSAGHGYWAWFACPKVVDLTEGTAEVKLTLGEYHASMVGNPSDAPATITGQDFAARWDPSTNSYVLSNYRQAVPLAMGEGAWVFSYANTEVRVGG